MKVAIMQPYIFPYLGYFQLVRAVDVFVFYDDVNFIKRGWINRNQLLNHGESRLFSIPLNKASQNKLINEIGLAIEPKWKKQFYASLVQSYKKAPNFDLVYDLVTTIMDKEYNSIADLTCSSVKEVSNFLGLSTVFKLSSEEFPETKGLERADRLITITKKLCARQYINPAGGSELYTKDYFSKHNIELSFIANNLPDYQQFDYPFVNGLSIIDVLMFVPKQEVLKMLDLYELN